MKISFTSLLTQLKKELPDRHLKKPKVEKNILSEWGAKAPIKCVWFYWLLESARILFSGWSERICYQLCWQTHRVRKWTQNTTVSKYVPLSGFLFVCLFLFWFFHVSYFNLFGSSSHNFVVTCYIKLLLRAFKIDFEAIEDTLPAW